MRIGLLPVGENMSAVEFDRYEDFLRYAASELNTCLKARHISMFSRSILIFMHLRLRLKL